MHFGLIPRTNRGIFCINELPDLAPKIQVGLFNVLEERDIQIRGYPVRLDLDVCMVFSANPEDYTNRGRIVTPLKDRIGSVVRTHYPADARDRHRHQRAERLARPSERRRPSSCVDPDLHQGDRRGGLAAGPQLAARQPAVGRLGPDVDRQPRKRGLQRRAAGPVSGEKLDRPARLRPGVRRGKLARQARADDERGGRARGQADPPDHRRGGQEHLRPPLRRPRVPRRWSTTSSRARASRSATCCRPRRCWNGSPRCRGCASEPRRSARLLPELKDADAREAATASAAEFILEGLHVHNKLNKTAKAGGRAYVPSDESHHVRLRRRNSYLRPLPRSPSSHACRCSEYSKWDGSQEFLPQSADKLFDQLSEYILQYGENVLRNLEDIDDDDMPEVVELIQKEGLIESDEEGKWRVTPKGIRRIQDKSLHELFQTFSRDGVGRHDTQQKGEGTVQLEDTRPYVYGDSLANINMHETLKNAYIRQGGGVPIKLSHEDYVVHETEYQTRCATVVLIDMSGSMGRYGKYYTTKKVAIGIAGDGPGPVSARLDPDDRLLHVRQPDDRARSSSTRRPSR